MLIPFPPSAGIHLPHLGTSREFVVNDTTFRVTNCRPTVFCLGTVPPGYRARFGTAAEILDDIDHVSQFGVLPGGDRGRSW